jgi:hypothetical protein
VGVKAQPVRPGVGQRGAATRPGPRTTGPLGPAAVADHLVTVNRRDLEAMVPHVIRALAQAGMGAATGTGIIEAPALETTAADEGCGPVPRQRRSTDARGQRHEREVTVSGWTLLVWSEAGPKLPGAATVGPLPAPAMRSVRAWVTQARTTLSGQARLHQVVFARGWWEGGALGWRQQHGCLVVVPAQDHLAATVEAQAHAAVGEAIIGGRRGHAVRPGPGKTAWPERRETAVVGSPGRTTDDQDGPAEQGRPHTRRACHPNPSPAGVVRPGPGREEGPGGTTVVLPKAAGEPPVPPCDAEEDRRLREQGGIKASQQPWSGTQPPHKTARAVRLHRVFPLLRCALATAYRRQGAQADPGHEPVGWQCWRRQLLHQTRDHVLGLAQDGYGIFHRAADSIL